MMALDLAAILVLIIIACSGFFVAFTVAFSSTDIDAPRAAYILFQILMGFTPAAWDIWDTYNILGKAILTLFLCICHFLIVTILITVLTNSFMAVVQNANEEHQFLFAVNTISLVKSDALFSYIAPTNVIGWLLRPATYILPFRKYVKVNRTIIKVTHFPLLWSVFVYERFILSRHIYEPTDVVEQRGRSTGGVPAFSMRGPTRGDLFSPGARLREPSVTTFHKNRALDEVFRRPYRGDDRTNLSERKQTVVHDWMSGVHNQGGAATPPEQPRSIVERLESRRPTLRRNKTAEARVRHLSLSRSVASDPEEMRNSMIGIPGRILEEDEEDDEEDVAESRLDIEGDSQIQNIYSEEITPGSDVDHGDTGAEDDADKENHRFDSSRPGSYFDPSSSLRSRPNESSRQASPIPLQPPQRVLKPRQPLAEHVHGSVSPQKARRQDRPSRMHNRTISSNTILYSPLEMETAPQVTQQAPFRKPQFTKAPISRSRSRSPHKDSSGPTTAKHSAGTTTPGQFALAGAGAKRPTTSGGQTPAKARPIMPPRGLHSTAPNLNLAGFLALDRHRKPSFNAMALDLASDLGDNRYRPDVGAVSGMPASFSTQMEVERQRQLRAQIAGRQAKSNKPGAAARLGFGFPPTRAFSPDNGDDEDDEEEHDDEGDGARRMSKIMLARMSTLEEGFREVLNEMREWRRQDGIRTQPVTAPGSVGGSVGSAEGTDDSSRRGSDGTEIGPARDGRRGRGKSRVVEGIDSVQHMDFGGEGGHSSSV